MKNHLKEKIFTNFLFIFEKEISGLSESVKRKLANELVENCYQVFIHNSEELIKQNSILGKEYENNRKEFRKFIEEVQNASEKLLTLYKTEAFVSKEYDNITGKYYLKPRTNMLKDTVQYFNLLNTLVISFYKNVYKIEQTSIEYPKISLF
jgi:hypothetical protein